VAEELHAMPIPSCAPSISPDVGDHERFVLSVLDHAEMGDECRKRVIGDLGPAAETREMKVDLPTFGRPTIPTSARSLSSIVIQRSSPGSRAGRSAGLAGSGGEPRVAATAHSALGDDERAPVGHQIGKEFPRIHIPNECAHRDDDFHILGILARPLASLAVTAVFRHVVLAELEIKEGAPAEGGAMMTSPPWPPSPPSGPPRGTNFSRRKLTQPRPPSPP